MIAEEVRAELGLESGDVAVVTAASFRPQKDYPNLLQAARLLADRDVPVRIVAIGQGPQGTRSTQGASTRFAGSGDIDRLS